MEDSRPAARSSASPLVATAVILLVVGAPLLYLLSTGPAVWLAEQGFIEPVWLEGFYAPIGYFMQHSTWFEALMQWYLGFFIDV